MSNYTKELDFLLEDSGLLPNTQISRDKVILYGAGSLGNMAIPLLNQIGVTPKYILDMNKSGLLVDTPITHPDDIDFDNYKDYTFLVTISSIMFKPIYLYLKAMGAKSIYQFYDYCEVYMPKVLPNGWSVGSLDATTTEGIKRVFDSLYHDTYSIHHYLQFLWWKLKRVEKVYKDYPVLSNQKYFKAPCFEEWSKHEKLLDGGAHFGQTVDSFKEAVEDEFDYIWAFEPDRNNAKELQESIYQVDKNKIEIHTSCLYDEVREIGFEDNLGFASKVNIDCNSKVQAVTIDSLNISPTIIKLHIEGDELKALNGAKETIKRVKPTLMVLADHNSDGLYKIGEFLSSLEGYKLYFYLHDYCGNSAIFYALNNNN
jgi:FkbM family methyltransferase